MKRDIHVAGGGDRRDIEGRPLGDGTASMSRLQAHLALEGEMLRLDAAGDKLADGLRDAMDPAIPSNLY